MLRPVRPSLNFWYYLGIISSPPWVFSLLAMDSVKKRTGLVAVLLIAALVISGSNYVLSMLYFSLQKNPKTGRFFCGYERAGKTIGYVLVFFGNIGLYYYSEKSVASVLTFLFLAFYCLSTLFCIQPYTDFGVLEFLLTASMNQAFSLVGIHSYSSWLVIIACIVIGAMRYCLEPVHPHREATRDEVQLPILSEHPPKISASSLPFGFLTRMRKRRYTCIKEDNVGVRSLKYDLGTIQAATNNFSNYNKIGEGGFGVVYKGSLPDGKEVAVKRLSRTSGQAAQEFKNEVGLVANLQHRNLVRLLGFCLGGDEKILVYEFVHNRGLDYFLFDPQERKKLDWSRRYKIIGGVAQGMLYLHEESELGIIHGDLKASNILLDVDINAKVSDFGTARILRFDRTQANTTQLFGSL